MSWFDTTGLTSLAKSAFKEAQKTIDKALDIQNDGTEPEKILPKEKSLTDPTPTPAKEGDFFSSWGLTVSDSVVTSDSAPSVITQSPSKAGAPTLWGSFTGSFFETEMQKDEAEKEKNAQLEMIVDDSSEVGVGDDLFSKSKLVVHGLSEDSEGSSSYSRLNSENDNLVESPKTNADNSPSVEDCDISSHKGDLSSIIKSTIGENYPINLRRLSDKQNSSYLNRLSIISSESGKNSSESIEVLCSQSLKTTPDSEGSLGLKLPSSSVEILPDSLMTPSSVELLGFSNSGESHESDDEFRSPLTSPIDHEVSLDAKASSKTTTDEDIKILNELNPGNNDDDETSAAEDTISYNSISEFTAPTILDSFNIVRNKEVTSRKSGGPFTNDMLDSVSPDKSATARNNDDFPITRAPSRNVTQFSSFSNVQLRDIAEKPSHFSNDNVIQPNPNSQSSLESYSSSNEGSWSDRTLNAEGENIMEFSNEETLVVNTSNAEKAPTNLYVKGLLEDAIDDKLNDKTSESSYCKIGEGSENINSIWKDGTFSSSSQSYEEVDKASVDHLEHVTLSNIEFATREQNSPVSSEGRSGDMVKIGSEQTSGHTSGDDLETTTSSDIEIIPSPNGDYGSVYSLSRHSPAKLPNKFKQSGNVVDFVLGKTIASKIRGHNRELSEASSQSNNSDDSHCSETERLLKRLSDMAEVLECREAKLIEISRKNIDLAENNLELKDLIENLQGKQDVGDVTLITEEYTQRMSNLEKKFQQAIREKVFLLL